WRTTGRYRRCCVCCPVATARCSSAATGSTTTAPRLTRRSANRSAWAGSAADSSSARRCTGSAPSPTAPGAPHRPTWLGESRPARSWENGDMDLGLSDRVYIVTGGSRGLGFAAAEALVADGARVVLSAPHEATAAAAAA